MSIFGRSMPSQLSTTLNHNRTSVVLSKSLLSFGNVASVSMRCSAGERVAGTSVAA